MSGLNLWHMAGASLADLYCCCILLLPWDERVIMMNTSLKNDSVSEGGKKKNAI